MRSFAITALLAATATAHFNLNVPTSAFFDEDQEGNGPCGGATSANFAANVSDFYVGSQPIAVRIGHPTTTFLFRVTTDANILTNFTALGQPVLQSGLGSMCVPVSAPANLVGQKGYLQVVGDSPDGLLYQCAAVNFVAGNAGSNSACTNSSGVSASFTTDAKLTALANAAGNSTANTTTGTNGTSSGTSTTNSTTAATSRSAAAGLRVESMQGLMSVVIFGGIASAAFLAQLL